MSKLLALSASAVTFGAFLITGCGQVVEAAPSVHTGSLTLLPFPVVIAPGQSVQLAAMEATDTASTPEDVASTALWESSSTAGMPVAQGKVTCKHNGVYTVSVSTLAMHGSATISCGVPVPTAPAPPAAPAPPTAPALAGIAVLNAPAIVRSDLPFALKVRGTYADNSTSDVTSQTLWKGDSVARVDASGTIYCNTAGEANLVATLGSYNAAVQVQCLMKQVTAPPGFVEHAAKFYGPFPSWLNVKDLGAKGDGVSDDTQALQAAITRGIAQSKTIWIPQGRYLISDTLHVLKADGISIIGASPLTTQLVWAGAAHGTMLRFEGSTHFRTSRIGWDCNGKRADTGVEITFDPNVPGLLYPTYDAIEDSKFSQCGTGIKPGFAGETTINRVHFDQNGYGVNLNDWDALNFNVIDSLFTDNVVGLSNYATAGGYNASNNVFVRSQKADMEVGNTQAFSIRHNLSVGSAAFFQDGPINSGAAVTLEGNVVVDTLNVPIIYGNQGTVTLLDNTFIMSSHPQRPLFIAADWLTAYVHSIGNTYTTNTPYQAQAGSFLNVTSEDEAPQATVPASSWVVPTETYIPPASDAAVFEVPAGGTGEDIQNAVNEAARVSGGATVHLPASSYIINTTLTIPDVPGLTVLGDGQNTDLRHGPMLLGPVVRTVGSAEVDDLFISGSPFDASLEVLVNDQPSTNILVDLGTTANTATSMSVAGLDHARINTRASTLNGKTGVTLTGGLNQANGTQTLGSVDAFMTTADTYNISHGGHFLISDGWHDGGQSPVQAIVSGNSMVTHQGGAICVASPTGIEAVGLTGQLSMVGTQIQTTVSADAASTGTIGFIGSLAGRDVQIDAAGPNTKVVHAADIIATKTGYVLVKDKPDTAANIERSLSQSRTEFVIPREPLATSATLVRLHRVMAGDSLVGLSFSSNGTTAANYTITPSSGSNPSGSCPAGSLSLDGSWSLVSGGDGFNGLMREGAYLANTIAPADGIGSLGLSASMMDAGQRWVVQPAGDGLFHIINRADGGMLTRNASGCGSVSAAAAGDRSQEWKVAAN